MRFAPPHPILRRAAFVGCAIAIVLWACASVLPALAASGPFADFRGSWSGTGTIRQEGQQPERIRCHATYRQRGSSGHEIDLQLRCDSDSYKFDLTGQFAADGSNHISGSWNERTRGVGGSVYGVARGSRVQIHVDAPGLSATLSMTTRNRRQSVSIDAHGGGQVVNASITLHRG